MPYDHSRGSLEFRVTSPGGVEMRNAIIFVLSVAAWAAPAHAGIVLTLSDLSSDETSPDDLSATLAFTVSGSSLDLIVTNATSLTDGFDITEIYFNTTLQITGLTLGSGGSGWTLLTDQRADGFGTFDYALLNDSGNDLFEIAPGESLSFTFGIVGDGFYTDADFTTQLSSIPPGSHPAIAAAKFVSGPGDDSAFGAVIPEPATGLLMLSAIAMLTGRRRRHA